MSRSGPQALALPATVVTAALWFVVACSVGGTQPHTAAPEATAPRATAPAAPTTAVGTTNGSTPAPSAQTIATAPASSNNIDQPPEASLSAGSASVAGLVGTYCWHNACLDADPFTDRGPALPALTVDSGATQLHFSLAGGQQFADWSASYVDVDGNVKQLGGAESSFDPDAAGASLVPVTEAVFAAPPAGGQSIVQVFVRFAEGGDASYGWNVTIP